MKMKEIKDLNLGYRDAENYKGNNDRSFFSNIFIRTQSLDKICNPNTYFLVGEKGTGKTAYAVYFKNTSYNNHHASLNYIRETEYNKFVQLKKSKNLTLSDYTNIWKVIIYLLIAKQIKEKERSVLPFTNRWKFEALENAIEEYYNSAFSPEILYAINFAEDSRFAAELLAKHFGISAKIAGEEKTSISFQESRFQTNLLYIQNSFENAFKSLKLEFNHLLFIDGIDIRPYSIDYDDYVECVKGLANAVWSINSDFFGDIKGSKGKMRAILLIRPDIFNTLGLQNQNSKIRDNSAVLSWLTTYPGYRNSEIFLMADRLLSIQQENHLPDGAAWDYYFPYNAPKVSSRQLHNSSFINFLRYSLYRPRDILTILDIQRENLLEASRDGIHTSFSEKDFTNPSFTKKYSDYMLGEVKDHMVFYYKNDEYELLLNFFHYLQGTSRFDYQAFTSAFTNFSKFLVKNNLNTPAFMLTPDIFLQFLYDLYASH